MLIQLFSKWIECAQQVQDAARLLLQVVWLSTQFEEEVVVLFQEVSVHFLRISAVKPLYNIYLLLKTFCFSTVYLTVLYAYPAGTANNQIAADSSTVKMGTSRARTVLP